MTQLLIHNAALYLQVNVVLFVLFDDDLTSQLALRQIIGIYSLQTMIEGNHGLQVLAELSGRRDGH